MNDAMSPWVLVIYIATWRMGAGITYIPMPSQTACISAERDVKARKDLPSSRRGGSDVMVFCLQRTP